MPLYQDRNIHELTVETISELLEKSAWKTDNQTITSAITNDNDLEDTHTISTTTVENTDGVSAFSDIKFDKRVKRVLDVGGGKYDCNCNYMQRTRNIELLVWDPYNRSSSHNTLVQTEVVHNNVDAATSMSVLNVISEPEARLAHINTLKAALVIGGKAYFKLYLGEPPLRGSYLPFITESYYQANSYADRFLREIEIVFGIGNVHIDKSVPNLIVAIKLTNNSTEQHDIVRILRNSQKESVLLSRIREKSMNVLCGRANIYQLLSTGLSFFKKLENQFIEQNRHMDSKLQQEHDKRYGLVLYKK